MLAWMRASALVAAAALTACLGCHRSIQYWYDFFDRYCEYQARCCTQSGLRGDPAVCCAGLGMFPLTSIPFDPRLAGACLNDLDAGRFPPDFCPPSYKGLLECYNKQLDNRPLGAPCLVWADCAPSKEGSVDCAYPSHVCQEVLRGREGDGPCLGGVADDTSTAATPPRVFDCYPDDGLVCDETAKICRRLAAAGDPCSSFDDCDRASYCASDGRCTPTQSVGDACDPAEGGCGSAAFCAELTGRCTPYLALGASCSSTSATALCVSFACVQGRCVSEDEQFRDAVCLGIPP
jgi:hypothetical protein